LGAGSKALGILALIIGVLILIPSLTRSIIGFAVGFSEGSAEVILYSLGSLIACIIAILLMWWGYKQLKKK